ncbi:MAG: LysM peptidoglycan-binding domain-containing protein [Chloroflexi bacterium]|nr:LysM peptidoglycan-binding domain-containing protein [Chloroflexota bacterium]
MTDGDGAANDDDILPGRRVAGPFRSTPADGGEAIRVVCPFLALELADGQFGPAEGEDGINRCIAIGEPIPQSSRQQQFVCLTGAHVNCPRFLRGVLVAGMPALAPAPAKEPISPAVVGAGLVLAAALAASFGFLAIRGGFGLSLPSSGPDQAAAVVSAGVAGPSVAPALSVAPSPGPVPTATLGLTVPHRSSPSPSPSPTSSPTPLPTATPAPTPTPRPTSDRYALLTKCPSTNDCWIYVIRSGDNLRSIANYFGVSYDRMIAMNPGMRTPIHAGDRLRIPTPTR